MANYLPDWVYVIHLEPHVARRLPLQLQLSDEEMLLDAVPLDITDLGGYNEDDND